MRLVENRERLCFMWPSNVVLHFGFGRPQRSHRLQAPSSAPGQVDMGFVVWGKFFGEVHNPNYMWSVVAMVRP